MSTYIQMIADYFDGKMTPDEEIAFMDQVGQDAQLRELFDRELAVMGMMNPLVRAGAPVRRFTPYRLVAAAAIVAAVVGALIYFAGSRKASPSPPLVAAVTDTTAPMLAARYLKPYEGERDPIGLSYYYQQYRQHHYAVVLAAKPADYAVKGMSGAPLDRYMQLYKGLSLLEQHDPVKARTYLDTIWKDPAPVDSLTYIAEWYSLMAALMENDSSGIGLVGGLLTAGPNPYRDSARSILKQLRYSINSKPAQ